MSDKNNNALAYIETIRSKAPEYLDLLTSSTEEEFELAFEAILERAVERLEQNSRNFKSLGEVSLSAALAMALNIPGLTVTQETHSNGHVDLTIVADHCVPARRKLGEAKIYHGPAYHFEGLNQLLTRYTTGREGGGLLIVYFQCANIAGLIQELRNRMDIDLPSQQQGPTMDHRLRWAFRSSHAHSSGEQVAIAHIGCNLYC